MVEIVNIWNLVALDTILDLIMNFVSLAVVSQFDDFFLEPFKQNAMSCFIGLKIPIKNFRKPKVILSEEEIKQIEDEIDKERDLPH